MNEIGNGEVAISIRRKVIGNLQWAISNGQLAMGNGQFAMGNL
jgi:hypothetical protein